MIRPDNSRLRFSPKVEAMRPTVGEPIAGSGKPNQGVMKRLNASKWKLNSALR